MAERKKAPVTKTFRLELYGSITRDIVWRECDAENEAEAREIAAREMPTYRLNAIEEITAATDKE